jgi:FAD/FMN-containing dehydrogenase
MAGIPVDPPLAVVRPRSTEDVSTLLKLCNKARVSVTTQGGMTGLVRATMPLTGEIVLSTERMTAIEEVDTGGGVVITQIGVPLQRLQERVGDDGFMFPLDLGARGSCTIGGNISTNAGGNRVIRYGMTRDLVLGLEAVLADGTILKGVRKYIKNNTGIDLKQLFVGTEGTLGVVTRAALRIFPAPAEQQVALCALASFDKVRAFLELARKRLGGDLTAFEVMWNEYYRLTRTGERCRRATTDRPSVLCPDGILQQRRRAHPRRRGRTARARAGAGHHIRRDDFELRRRGRGDLENSRLLGRTLPRARPARRRLRHQHRHRQDGGVRRHG